MSFCLLAKQRYKKDDTFDKEGDKPDTKALLEQARQYAGVNNKPEIYLNDLFVIASTQRELDFMLDIDATVREILKVIKSLSNVESEVTQHIRLAKFFMGFNHQKATEMLNRAELRVDSYKDFSESDFPWISTCRKQIEEAKKELERVNGYFTKLQELVEEEEEQPVKEGES